MKTPNKWMLAVGALAATAAVGYAQFQSYNPDVALNTKTGQALKQAITLFQRDYLKDVKTEDLLQGAIKGMANSLNDKFVYYFPPEEASQVSDDAKGEFFGIGALIGAANSDGTGAVIDQVYRNQPAARAGLQSGDRIVKIDGQDVSTLTSNKVVTKIRGPKGTTVKIGVLRGQSNVEVAVTRDTITIVSVETSMLPGGVGYIALNTFNNEKVFDQFAAAVNDMNKKGVGKLVLDLRDNGGGLLTAGIFVADEFLKSGPIVSLRGRDGKADVAGAAENKATDYTGKLVVLVNKNSASASEIVAGALQDYGRAKVVGEKTVGKGVAQVVDKLVDGSQLWIVNEEWLTPKGRSIQEKGITPDVVVEDNRYPKALTFTGTGVKAGTKLSLSVDGQKVDVTADKDGQFTYTAPPKRLKASEQQGTAIVDVKNDAQLISALNLLK